MKARCVAYRKNKVGAWNFTEVTSGMSFRGLAHSDVEKVGGVGFGRNGECFAPHP